MVSSVCLDEGGIIDKEIWISDGVVSGFGWDAASLCLCQCVFVMGVCSAFCGWLGRTVYWDLAIVQTGLRDGLVEVRCTKLGRC